MRCKCCDSPKTRYWKDDFYCAKCRKEIGKVLREAVDDRSRHIIGPDPKLVHGNWDKENG